jgi:hypothetical protein
LFTELNVIINSESVKKLTEWELCSSRPVGRPRLRWLDQVEEDLKKMKVRNWREKCKDRRLWNEIVEQAKNPPRVVAPSEEEEEENQQRVDSVR